MPLVAAVAWAVVIMHSLPDGASHSTLTTSTAMAHTCCSPSVAMGSDPVRPAIDGGPMSPENGPHGVSHLCLAILAGLVAGVLAMALRRTRLRPTAFAAGSRSTVGTAARPPPRLAGRSLLNVVCVLRA